MVRAYVSPADLVFGVAWQGPKVPDLTQVLGACFPAYQAALPAPVRRQGPVMVHTEALVVEMSGHMRAFAGRAYLPSLVPCADRKFKRPFGATTPAAPRMVEYIACLSPIEVAQVGSILERTIASLPPDRGTAMILHVLIAMVAGWLQRHQQQVITYLIEENRVLKAQLGGRRLQAVVRPRQVTCLYTER